VHARRSCGASEQHDNGSRDQGPPTAACERVSSRPHHTANGGRHMGARKGRKPAQVAVLNPVRKDVNTHVKLLLCFFYVLANSPIF
jgi:hypothetical protein